MQQHVPGHGGFTGVATNHGASTFPPGDTVVSGNFCYNAPANVNVIKIEFALDDAAHNCVPHRMSPAMRPCRHTGGCPLAFEDVPEDSSYFSAVNFALALRSCVRFDIITAGLKNARVMKI